MRTLSALTCLLLCTLPGCRAAQVMDSTVVILVLDGVRLEESLGDEPSSATGEDPWDFLPEVWDTLVPGGVRATNAWNLASTTTAPAHATIVSGRRQPLANYAVEDEPGLYRPDLPSLTETVRRERLDKRFRHLVMGNTQLIKPVAHSLWPADGYQHGAEYVLVTEPDSDTPSSSDQEVLDSLQQYLQDMEVRFALANLHQVDRSGHYGDATAYLDDVRALDQPVVDFSRWLFSQHAYKDDTWLFIVADHGRHSTSDDDPQWRHHGCACNGCRRVPFLLLGPGVRAGETLDSPLLLADIAPTAAALLGVNLPWADGLVRDDLFLQPIGASQRSGIADLAVVEGHMAVINYLDDPARRSELRVDDTLLSDPYAIAVEAPALAVDGHNLWVCFREITLDPAGSTTPWVPRCMLSTNEGQSWSDIGAPEDDVGSDWRPRLMAAHDTLVLVYANNPNGVATAGVQSGGGGSVSVDVALYDGQWQVASAPTEISFPMNGDALLVNDEVVLAMGGGSLDDLARHSRDTFLGTVQLREGNLRWSDLVAADMSRLAPSADEWRMEHPALRLDESGGLWLAANGYVDKTGVGVVAHSLDDGKSWTEAQLLDLPAAVMPHLDPVWLGDRAIFATVDASTGQAALCKGMLGVVTECQPLGSERILRLTADGETLYGLVDTASGQWEVESWTRADFGG